MIFYPDSPRWLLVQERDEEAFQTLSKLRRLAPEHPDIVAEVLDIKAAIMLESSYVREHYAGLTGFKLHVAQVYVLRKPQIPQANHSNSIRRLSQTSPGLGD